MIERSKEFITLALKLSYTAAAEELHMSTSALSRHIASLESSLGFTLLNRDPLSLTEAGQYYLEAASLLIEDFDRIVEEGRRIASQSTNHLTVYMLPVRTAFSDVIYQAAAHMRRENPGLSINFCVDDRFHTAEEEGYERLNPDLVKLPFQKTITAPIYMAYSHKTTNPLRDEFMSLIQSLSQEKGLLEDA